MHEIDGWFKGLEVWGFDGVECERGGRVEAIVLGWLGYVGYRPFLLHCE